jgi:hypothetical protein
MVFASTFKECATRAISQFLKPALSQTQVKNGKTLSKMHLNNYIQMETSLRSSVQLNMGSTQYCLYVKCVFQL